MKKLLSLLCLLTCLVGSVYGKTTLTIASQSVSTKVGMSDKRISVSATDANGNMAYGLSFTYSGYDSNIISVADNGVITGVGEGTTYVTVSFAGNSDYEAVTASNVITVNVSKQTPTLSVINQTVAVGNTTGAVSVTATDENGDNITGLTYTFTCSDTGKATVNSTTGALTGVANGTATITVSFAGNTQFEAATTTFTVTVVTANTVPVDGFEGLNMLESRSNQTEGVKTITSTSGLAVIEGFSNGSRHIQRQLNQTYFQVQNGGAYFTLTTTQSGVKISNVVLYTNQNGRSLTGNDGTNIMTGTQTENKGKNWAYDFSANPQQVVTFTNSSGGNIGVSAIEITYTLDPGIYFIPAVAEVSVGSTYNLKDNNLITVGTAGTVTYTSSNPNYVSVDANGIVTGAFPGEAVITATDGSHSATCTVTVSGTAGRAAWSYDSDTYTLTFGTTEGWLPETIDDNPYMGLAFGATGERQYYQAYGNGQPAGTFAIDANGYRFVYVQNAGTAPSMGSYYVLTPSLNGSLTVTGFVSGVNSIELVASDGTVKATYTPTAAYSSFTWTVEDLMMGETYYLYANTPNTPRHSSSTEWATLCLTAITYAPTDTYTYPQTWAYNHEWFSTSTNADLDTEAAQVNWTKSVNTYYNTEAYKPLNAKLDESAGHHIEVFEGDWLLYTAKNAASIGIIPSVYVSLKDDGSCITIPRVPTGYYVIVEADCTGGGTISINGRERSLDTEIKGFFYRNTEEQNVVVSAASGEMRIYSIAVLADYNATRFEFCDATADQGMTSRNAYHVNYNWYADTTHPDNLNKGESVEIRNPLDVPVNMNVKYTFVDAPEGYYFNTNKTEYSDNSGNMTITIPRPAASVQTIVKADYSESLGLDPGAKVAYFRLDVHYKERGGRFAVQAGSANRPTTGQTAIVDGMTMTFGGWRDYKNYAESDAANYSYSDNNGNSVYDRYSSPSADKKGVPMGYYAKTAGSQNPLNESTQPYFNDQKSMFLVPCRGTFYKFEPMEDGLLTVNLLQNGLLQNLTEEANYGTLSRRVLYMIDETGENIQAMTPQTGDLNYPFGVCVPRLAKMNVPVYIIKAKNNDQIIQKIKDDYDIDYVYDGLQQVKYLPQDKVVDDSNIGGGYVVISETVTYYSFPVKAGKTYYLFVRGSKLGMYGFEFDPENRGTAAPTEVTLSEEGTNDITPTNEAYITSFDRKLNFGAWNALVLPYSMNEWQVQILMNGGSINDAIDRQLSETTMDMVYFDRVEGNRMYFKRHYYRTIVAGKPVLVKPILRTSSSPQNQNAPLMMTTGSLARTLSGGKPINYKYVTITDVAAESTETIDNYKWAASYGTQTIKPGDYYLNASGNIIRRALTSSEVTLKGFRAFLSDESGDAANRAEIVNAALLDVENGNATVNGITEVVIEDEQGREVERIPASEIFDLGGKKVADDNKQQLPKGVYIQNGKKMVVK